MSIQLRLRIILGALFGALLVLSLGTALQFRELAVSVTALLNPDARLLETAAELQRLLAASQQPEFEQAFRNQLQVIDEAELTEAEQQLATEIYARFEQLLERRSVGMSTPADEQALALAVAAFTAGVGHEVTQTAEAVVARSTTAAVGLGILGVIGLAVGASSFRNLRRGFVRKLTELDRAGIDVMQGDSARRVPVEGDDELARIARALNFALDLHDRSDAEMRGRNREIRAVLVALLRQFPQPVAITGIDGEVIASTLSTSDEDRLRSLTPQVRKAASILLSRGFVSATELTTDVSFAEGGIVHIRALALGEQRIVGWLAKFDSIPAAAPAATTDHNA
jgi:methyl-accepting chemotaxis protein